MTPAAPTSRPPDELVAADLPCMRCGYNLRTRPIAARCPECGTTAKASVRAEETRRAELVALRVRGLPWLIATRRAVHVALLAWAVNATAAIVATVNVRPRSGDFGGGGASLALPVTAYVLAGLASWRLLDPLQRRRWRLPLRAIVVASVGWLGVYFLNDDWARAYLTRGMRHRMGELGLWETLPAIGSLLSLSVPFAILVTVAAFVRIASLARRRFARIVLGLHGLCFVLIWLLIIVSLLPRTSASSAEVIQIVSSTLGQTPAVGLLVREAIPALPTLRYGTLRTDEIIECGVVVTIVATTLASMMIWTLLVRSLSRAIELEHTNPQPSVRARAPASRTD